MGAFRTRIAGLEIVPSAGGVFEVSLDGETIFSKRQTGRFPEYEEIARHLEARAGD